MKNVVEWVCEIMWKEKIELIRERRARRNRHLNEGCSQEEINMLQKEVNNKFQYYLPEDYVEFLSVINGLEYNGLVIYGIDEDLINVENNQNVTGYIDTNQIWYENEEQREYMFFADNDMSWYCYNMNKKTYMELDKPSGELEQEFDSFADMLESALENSLA